MVGPGVGREGWLCIVNCRHHLRRAGMRRGFAVLVQYIIVEGFLFVAWI